MPIAKRFEPLHTLEITNRFLDIVQLFDGKSNIDAKTITSKQLYCLLLKKCAETHPSQLYWETLFSIAPGNKGWYEIYKRKIKNIISKKLCEFNFKILNRILFIVYIINK